MTQRIFLSAATNEFGTFRQKLAAMLQRSGINVEHQEIFPQTTSDTVRKLGNLIKDCRLLIHVVGHIPGSIANAAAVTDLLDEIRPDEFLTSLPELRKDLGDLSCITYTQWEAFLALHLDVPVFLYVPCNACAPDTQTLKDDFAQKRHLDRLRLARRPPEWCRDESDFIGKILADVYRHFGLAEGAPPSAIPSYLPERNPHFRGRKADLAHLHETLDRSATIGITQQVALLAAGGVGKSSLAFEFGWECFASTPTKFPGGVFWCDCRGREVASLADGLAAFAGPLGIHSEESDDSLPAACKVRDRLASGPPSLLILDNVLDSEQWKDKEWAALLPAGSCRRLLTTRAENLGDHFIPMVRLDRLSIPDARSLLHAYRNDVLLAERDDAVKEIINWFGGLAIGLTVVGIYLRSHSKITWDAYWKSLCEKKLNAVRDTEELATPKDYAIRVDAVIDDLFHSQSPAEQRVLLYASILSGDDVSDRWLIELLSDDLSAGKIKGKTPPGYPSLAQTVIERLMQRGILLRLIDTPVRKTVFLHQVIRERLREILQTDPAWSREVAANVNQFAVRNYHRLRQWTQTIVESASFLEAQKLLASMSETNCDPNVFTFNSLLSKARSDDEAKAVIDQMKKAGVKPDVFTFTAILSRAGTYEEAKAVLDRMQTAGVKPNVRTFNSLLSKAGGYDEATAVVTQMLAVGEKPDMKTFRSLLSKAGSYEEATAIFDQLQKAGEKPDVHTFYSLLSKAGSYEEAKAIFDQMQQAGMKPDVATFNTLLSKAGTYTEGKAVFDQIQQAGMKPKAFTFNALLSKAGSYEGAKAIFDQMRKAGVQPDVFTFTTLLSKAGSYEEAKAIFDQMQKAGVQPNEVTFNALLSKARSYNEAKAIFDQMRKAGEHPDRITLTTLLSKAGSYAETKAVLEQMQKAGVMPNVKTFVLRLSKAGTYIEGKSVFDQLQQAGVKPNVDTFNVLLSKAGTYIEGKSVFDQLQQAGVKPNLNTFNVLLSKAGSYTEGKAVFDQMQQAGVKPTVKTFNTLLSKAGTYTEGKAVFGTMQQECMKPDVATYNMLLSKAGTYTEGKAVFDQLQQAGVKSSRDKFKFLLSKAGSCDEAKFVLEQMQNAGTTPDLVNFTLLLSKIKTYDEAKAVLDQMQKLGAKPDAFTLTALFSKQEGLPPVGEVLRWYYEKPYHPADPLNALIGNLKKLNRVEEAMTIALQHPQLTAGQELMRDFPACALALFESAKAGDSCHPTAGLALGILAMETNRPTDAKSHLQQALQQASLPKTLGLIQSKLKLLG